jgi:hypothetical protein
MAGALGVGELPDMSIPGISAGMLAVGVGVLPDMSIPGMSAGMPAVLAGVGELSDPTVTGSAAALTTVAADDSWCEVSVNDPRTAIAAYRHDTDPPPPSGGSICGPTVVGFLTSIPGAAHGDVGPTFAVS